jgi:hypothetical protein
VRLVHARSPLAFTKRLFFFGDVDIKIMVVFALARSVLSGVTHKVALLERTTLRTSTSYTDQTKHKHTREADSSCDEVGWVFSRSSPTCDESVDLSHKGALVSERLRRVVYEET